MALLEDTRSEVAKGRPLPSPPGAGWAAFAGMVIAVAAMREGARQLGEPVAVRVRSIDLLDTVFVGAIVARLVRRTGARALGA